MAIPVTPLSTNVCMVILAHAKYVLCIVFWKDAFVFWHSQTQLMQNLLYSVKKNLDVFPNFFALKSQAPSIMHNTKQFCSNFHKVLYLYYEKVNQNPEICHPSFFHMSINKHLEAPNFQKSWTIFVEEFVIKVICICFHYRR